MKKLKPFLQKLHNLPGSDFFLLTGWALLYPDKISLFYFLGFAALAILFIAKNLFSMRNMGISRFSILLFAVNLLLIVSVLLTPNRQKSLLFLSDLILVSFVVVGFENGRRDRGNCLKGLCIIISLLSLITLVLMAGGAPRNPGFFFANPILQGILSGLAAVLLVRYLSRRFSIFPFVLFLINLLAVFASASKAAFIGTMVFSLLSIPLRRKSWIFALLGLAALTFLIPNPIREMFHFSLTKDPYASNRIDIWAMSLRMTRANWPSGVGLGSFPEAAPAYNFPQEKGPARYFKVPRQSHNDYLRLLAEAGLPGLLILILLAAVVFRRLIRKGFAHRSGAAVLYLLFQAFLFNILFHPAFFLIFLYLLDDWIDAPQSFHSSTPLMKLSLTAFFPLILLFSYIFPAMSHHQLNASRSAPDFMQAFRSGRLAARITPLALEPQAQLASLFRRYYSKTHSPAALVEARYHLQRAHQLNPYFSEAPLAEASLLETLITRNMKYAGLEQEILRCLERARAAAPLDPFIRLHQARIHLEFHHPRQAAEEAARALELEPRCLEALVFIQRHFPSEMELNEFRSRVREVLTVRKRTQALSSSYLDQLFSLPPGDNGWLRAAHPDLWPAPRPQQPVKPMKVR